MEKQKGHVSNLLEDTWFFGNNLSSNKPSSTMMLMSHSNASTSSNTNTSNNLPRTPSLPSCLGIIDPIYEQQQQQQQQQQQYEEEEEARMGDLIREAMPSLPSFRGKEDFNMEGINVGRLTRRATIDSSVLLSNYKDDGIDLVESCKGKSFTKSSSMLLPPKCASTKGRKNDASDSKNRLLKKKSPLTTETKSPNVHNIKAQKSLSSVETEQLRGFTDLFEPNKIGPKVTHTPSTLQRKWSLDSNYDNHRPKLSWADHKSKHEEDMKAQIKLWARNVASNVKHVATNNSSN